MNQQDGGPLPWIVGDNVHILVKVQPAIIAEKDNIRQWEPAPPANSNNASGSSSEEQQAKMPVVIDFGETTIMEEQYGP